MLCFQSGGLVARWKGNSHCLPRSFSAVPGWSEQLAPAQGAGSVVFHGESLPLRAVRRAHLPEWCEIADSFEHIACQGFCTSSSGAVGR